MLSPREQRQTKNLLSPQRDSFYRSDKRLYGPKADFNSNPLITELGTAKCHRCFANPLQHV